MGQAKQRGTFEERTAEAIRRDIAILSTSKYGVESTKEERHIGVVTACEIYSPLKVLEAFKRVKKEEKQIQ